MTTLIMLAIVVFGVVTYPLLPVSAMPVIEYPTIQVSTTYPGASPDTIAKLVSTPLEREFMVTQGIELVTSMNTYQTSQIILQFHPGFDINVAATNTLEAINKALAELPDDLPQNPTYTKVNPTDTPVTYIAFFSDTVEAGTLYEYGYTFVGQQLGTINGVAQLETFGYPYAVRLKVDPQALAAKNISFQELADAINNANPQQPTGKLYGPQQSMAIITDGQLPVAEKYNDVIIKEVDGEPVRLRDLGAAYDSLKNDKELYQWVSREFDEPVSAFFLGIYREMGYNTFEVCDQVDKLVEKLRPMLPRGIHMIVPFSQSLFIQQAITDVELTLLISFLLVVFVVFFYLGKVRNSIIPLITLPITVTGTLAMMYVFGYSINILTASAITISIGFLIDDAIVVLENIVRWVQKKKKNPHHAAILGSQEIIITIVSISLCLVAVFIPLIMLKGIIGSLFHQFAGVVVIAVIFSAFISLALTPMLCSRFVPEYSEENKTKFEKFSEWWNEKLVNMYKPCLRWALGHKVIVLVLAIGSIAASAFLFYTLPQEFLPENDLGAVECFAVAENGTSPELMNQYLNQVSKICMKYDFVHTVARIESTPTDNQATFFLNLVDYDKRPNIWECMAQVQKELDQLIGIKVFMKAFPLMNLQIGSTQSAKARYQYTLQGFKDKELFKSAEKFLATLETNTMVANVSSDFQPYSPMVNVQILRDQAHTYGNLNAKEIENALMYAYGETYISKINVPQDMYYVILEVERKFGNRPGNLQELYLSNSDNEQVNINSVTNHSIFSSPLTVNHIDALPAVTISFDIPPHVPLSSAIAEVEEIAKETLDETVIGGLAGNTQAFEQASKQFGILFAFAIFVIYIILGILYENFIEPITPLMALPVAMLGALLTLLILGKPISIYALVGILMLLGIVMKNGILMVDFAVDNLNRGMEVEEAIIDASIIRFRPILMTTIAAMVGSIPIALGAGGSINQGRAPLGQVIVGGLIFSQAVTLFVTPVVFVYVTRIHRYFTSRYALFRETDDAIEGD